MKTGNRKSIYKIIMLIMLTAIITFIITSVFMYNVLGKQKIKYILSSNGSSTIGATLENFKKFIEKNYIGNIDENKMLESAIKGYVEGLEDEYSEYISPDEMKEYMEDTTGKYVGIGVYLSSNTKTNQIVVLAPMKGSPAEEAGIKSGDIINKIDGKEYTGEELTKASNALKQEEGTKVKIEIIRDDDTLEIEVERKTIKIYHVESEVIDGNIGYLELTTFDDGCYEEFLQKWKDLESKKVKSLIIDLRNNGGGIVDESTKIADLFVEKDKTTLITSAKGDKEEITKAKQDKIINVPTIILVNENTASSSEILASAIRENCENAKIVGKTTFGKGVIQTIFTLTDGSGLKLTTNEYFTPNRNKINKTGIKPDIEVEFPEDKSLYSVDKEKDPQLQKAIELLKN